MSDLKQDDGMDLVELKDCGKASRVTQGLPYMVMFELGFPPFNKLFFF